jgi:hypothetical protein
MKKKSTPRGLMLTGSMPRSGVTIYERNGRMVTRTASSSEKRSNTRSQFIQRQKMRHTIALWKTLKYCDTIFTQHQTAYLNFASLATRLPVVFIPRGGINEASFLMPGIPVSDGTRPVISQQLGEVNGIPALLTDLTESDLTFYTKFRLYTAEQTMAGEMPRVRFSMREVRWSEMTAADRGMALVGEEFADEMKGWALVRVVGDSCSQQTIVTRCTLYQQYTTEEALQTAAKSYGGLTRTLIPTPQ